MLVEIEVKRPVAIPGDGKSRVIDLKVGINSIDDSLFNHWFVKGLVESGAIGLLKRKTHNFKSLDQIAEEKKQKILAEKKSVEEKKEPVVFATHATMAPVGTVLDQEEKKEEVTVVKTSKAKEEKPKVVRRKRV
jgi:hypothetical protein